MEQESVTILSISQLIHQSRPLTAASSLSSSKPKPRPKLQRSDENQNNEFSSSTNPKTLKPLNAPTVIIGTLNLPIHKNLSPSPSNSGSECPKVSCFSFSDDDFSICCDILDFHPRLIGKKIRVLAWNYIPFKCGGGFLEIIKWAFVESSAFLVPCSLKLESFPLSLDFSGDVKENCKARYYVHGVIESVSPVTFVPCNVGGKDDKAASLVSGFLTKVLVCDCKLCSCSDPDKALCSFCEPHSIDSLTKSFIVYFYDFASCWHPVVSRLVGTYVSLTGLKKKLIFIGKQDSQLMYVTSEKSTLHLSRLRDQSVLFQKINILGKGEFGEYTGVVTEIHMQGMVVELDKKVMLLLTDQLLNITHSLRVGAIVSVRNVHFVHPNFSWTKLLVLGACFKTSIHVKSFSPMKTRCNFQRHSESLLRKFIDSLSFSARMWVLLTISCFNKKFSGILSEKDILGSKHKQGVAQKYCTSCLPSSVVRSRHGIFTEYCKHDSCGCGSEPYCGHLKLVVPMSSFISHCEATWKKMSGRKTDSGVMSNNNRNSPLICGRMSFSQPVKRVLQSKDIDVVLLGSLKNSLSSGSLQLIDATGNINTVLPDLPSSWSIGSIYQVYEFTVVMEGTSDQSDHFETVPSGLFSCKSIFNNAISVEERNLAMFLSCRLKDELYRSRPLCPGFNWKENLEDLSGRFHLLKVTHIFPVLQKLQGDQIIADRFSVFAEAIILPWDLLIPEENVDHMTAVSETLSCDSMKYYARSREKRTKRCKTIEAPSSVSSDVGNDSVGSSSYCLDACKKIYKEKICSGSSYPLEIPCITVSCEETLFKCRKVNTKITSSSNSGVRKVLLEFDLDSFCKFQSLKIGGYYIIKHHKEDRYCSSIYSNILSSSKIHITSRASLLSISFSSPEALLETGQTPLIHNTFFSNKVSLPEDSDGVELPALKFMDACPQSCSDIKLFLSPESLGFLEGNINLVGQGSVKPIVSFNELTNISGRMVQSVQSPETLNLDVFLPKGRLISLHGHVVAFHSIDHSSLAVNSGHTSSVGDYVPNFIKGITQSACIHVLVENHVVKIFGNLSKHALPVGFGAGVDATFHRILLTVGQNELLLIPASVIVISSALVVNNKYEGNCDITSAILEFPNISLMKTGPVSLISEMDKCSNHMLLQLHCKIIAVYVLVLEKNRKVVQSHPITHSRSPVIKIPLAGFILDDGSSLCCCWTNNDKALTLLKLDKENRYDAARKSSRGSKKTCLTKSRNPNSVKLDKILQQHERVVVRNCGSIYDSSFQDLILSVGSNKNISSRADEDFLKLSILNACFRSTLWTVSGCAMDSDDRKRLENQLMSLNMPNLPMRNIWGVDVNQSNPVMEARSIIEELNMK